MTTPAVATALGGDLGGVISDFASECDHPATAFPARLLSSRFVKRGKACTH